MLHVDVKIGVTVFIGNDITVTISKTKKKGAKLSIHAPEHIKITRSDYKPKVADTPHID